MLVCWINQTNQQKSVIIKNMDLNRLGDPGTGNHYTEIKQEIHIGSVGVYNNATTIHNTYADGKLVRTEMDNPLTDMESVRKEILDYVISLLDVADMNSNCE